MNTATKTTAKAQAIAIANAHLKDTGLPTYSDLLEVLEQTRRYLRAKAFDAGDRSGVAFVIETALEKAGADMTANAKPATEKPYSITVERTKRSATITAKGTAAQALFDAMTSGFKKTEAVSPKAEPDPETAGA